MKRYRIIIIGAITLLIAIFIGFTVRINMIFPNAKDVTYTSDNPPIIDGQIQCAAFLDRKNIQD